MEKTEGGGHVPGSARAASCPELRQKPPPWSSSPSPSVCSAQQQTRKSRSDPPLQRTYRGIPHSSAFSESPLPLNKGTYKVLQLQPIRLSATVSLCSPHRWSRQASLLTVLFTHLHTVQLLVLFSGMAANSLGQEHTHSSDVTSEMTSLSS